jgi:plastocyanin
MILLSATLALSACGGGGTTSNDAVANVPGAVPLSTAVRSETLAQPAVPTVLTGDTANPVTVYIGFKLAEVAKSGYGPIAFYGPSSTGSSGLIYVSRGSKVQFYNADTTRHTASGLGDVSFPTAYDNTSAVTQRGTEIRNDDYWSTGALNPRQLSTLFTVAAHKVYYFGCYFHYGGSPQMRDAIVSQ